MMIMTLIMMMMMMMTMAMANDNNADSVLCLAFNCQDFMIAGLLFNTL